MRYSLILAAAGLFVTTSVSAEPFFPSSETDGPYAGLSVGYLTLSDAEGDVAGFHVEGEYDEGFALNAQLGYQFYVFRAELELGYARSGTDSLTLTDSTGASATADIDGDFDVYSATANLFYDFHNLTRFTPYFGGGIGAAYVNAGDATVTVGGTSVAVEGDSDAYMTGFGEAGLSVGLSDRVALVPAYRFVWFNSGGGGIDDDTAHLFKVGLRYSF